MKSWGTAIGWDNVLSSQIVNTFRYGFTKIVSDTVGTLNAPLNYFRFIDDLNEGFASSGRETPTHNFVDDITWIKGSHTMKFGANLRFSRIPTYSNARLVQLCHGQRLVGERRRSRLHPRPQQLFDAGVRRAACGGQQFQRVVCRQLDRHPRHHVAGDRPVQLRSATAPCCPRAIRCGGGTRPTSTSSTRRTAGVLGDKLTLTGGVRYSLASPPYETNGLQVAPTSAWASGSISARR